MRYEFHLETLAEYLKATLFYRDRQPGLDVRFVAAVEQTMDRILDIPGRWPLLREDVRRCLTHVFPYRILYPIEKDYILILAIMYCSRKPDYWKHRHKHKGSRSHD